MTAPNQHPAGFKQPRHRAASAALFLVALIWGSGFIMTELLITAEWSTAQIMAARFSIGALALLISSLKNLGKINAHELKSGIIAGLLIFTSFYLQTFGQRHTNVSNVALFTATNVVMVPFFALALQRERLQLHTILLALLSFVGMLSLSYKGGDFALNPGDPAILACAALFAIHIVYLSKQLPYCDASRLNLVQITTAAVCSLIVLLFAEPATAGFDLTAGLLPIFFLGLLSTCLCYYLQTKAQALVRPATVAIILALEGFFGSFFSLVLGYEAFSWRIVIGGVCIVTASILSNYFSAKAGTEAAAPPL